MRIKNFRARARWPPRRTAFAATPYSVHALARGCVGLQCGDPTAMAPPPLPPHLPGLLQQLEQPARCLRDAGCCGLCVLRLIGATERAGYQQPPRVVERLLDEYLLRRIRTLEH